MAEKEYAGTIKTKENFDEETAAKRFKKTFKGLGTDEAAIIALLVSHTSIQRAAIAEKYKAMYGQDLVDNLRDELGGHFEDAAVTMLTSPYDTLVQALEEAVTGAGTNEDVLTEVLCCRTGDEIESLSFAYEKKFGNTLDEALHNDLSGDYRDLMRGMATGHRDDPGPTDVAKARKDAQDLYDAGIGTNAGTEESEFINIMNNRSFEQLAVTFDEYEKVANETIEESIEKEFSGDMMSGLLSIVKRVRDPPGFFAEILRKSLSEGGPDDKTIIRLIISRSEIDLADIKASYKELYNAELYDEIKADTSGDYQKLLLGVIGK